MNHWVMDYETLSNCFVAVFEHFKTEEKKVFVIHELWNDLIDFLDFLKENKAKKQWHVSFNGLAFDAQISEHCLRNYNSIKIMAPGEAAKHLYDKAQSIISIQNSGGWHNYAPWDLSIKQLDVFKLNHWDNVAKKSSLKWIQYSMDWENLQEMPIHHTTEINTIDEINTIIDYCINDVRSTKRIMELSKDHIQLRRTLTKEYDIDLYNASEPRISKELFMMFLSTTTGIPKKELRRLRTKRNHITVRDIILPYVSFKTKTFNDLLDNFKMVVVDPTTTKGGFKCHIKYKDVTTHFGLGGVHGARKSGVYEAKDGWIIMTSDVTSFYPNLAIRNNWSPAHLPPKEFCEQYEWFFDERKKIPKKNPKNYVYKIILNSTYGLSNDKNSFLYDPEFTMRITINGQLSLMMLYEMLAEGIPESISLMQNTDGLEMMIPEFKKDKYLEICAEWERITNLQLEHDEYGKLFLADVNNYIASFKDENKKPKCKGRFDFENLALHKNKSFAIIPKAVYNYLINDTPPERFLMENRNIFDYCAGVKIRGNWEFNAFTVEFGAPVKKTLQRTIRYYVSQSGAKIVKINSDDNREIQLESGKWLQTVFNKYEKKPWQEYGINEDYYLQRIYKEINNICPPESKQLTLF